MNYLPSLIIAAVAAIILWKVWPKLTAKSPSIDVDALAKAIADADAKAAKLNEDLKKAADDKKS